MLVVVAPGQGAQKPQMFAPWLESDSAAAKLAEFGEAARLDLVRLGTTGSADEIKDTAVTQPLVVAAALLGAAELQLPAAVLLAGHSVGELAAGALAGVLDEVDAVRLAALRGAAMGRACAQVPTGMSAVVGGDPAAVAAALSSRDLVGANVNGGGQLVAAGLLAPLADLAANPPAGARVIPLPVAGAFHTAFMAPAADELAAAVDELRPRDPARALLTNADGSRVPDGPAYLRLLVRQMTRPVRWDLCMAAMRDAGVTGILELPPAGTLVGLAKRELRGVATMAVRGPDDVAAAAAFVAEHADPAELRTAVELSRGIA